MNAVLVEAGPVATGAYLAQDPAPPPGNGPEFGEASPLGLLVVILLGIAVIFLFRSMTKHLKRVPASFDKDQDATETPAGAADTGSADADKAEDEKPAENGAEK